MSFSPVRIVFLRLVSISVMFWELPRMFTPRGEASAVEAAKRKVMAPENLILNR